MFKKGFMVEVFGQEYDLSNCTEEERKEVEAWYEKNKEAEVPTDTDNTHGVYRTESARPVVGHDSDLLDIELALESLKSNPDFKPDLFGNPKFVELYLMVHPLGGNVSIADAAKQLGINKVTAYRRLEQVAKNNPGVYDLHKWPTKAQLDVYRLVHPSLGGLTYREAARALNSTYSHVVQMMCRMRATHPAAFAFERIKRPKVVSFNPKLHDTEVKEVF